MCPSSEKPYCNTRTRFFQKLHEPSSVDSEIICQGFETSLAMYNLIYGRLIADGDSATCKNSGA